MPVDFFKNKCSNTLPNKEFGLCDDGKNQAYINIDNKDDWLATVINEKEYNINFIAVDKCIELKREDGELDKSCDAMMVYSENILFIELKNRTYSGWIGESIKQLTSTIGHFKNNHDINIEKTAYIANRLRPQAKSFHGMFQDKFKDATSVALKIQATIDI